MSASVVDQIEQKCSKARMSLQDFLIYKYNRNILKMEAQAQICSNTEEQPFEANEIVWAKIIGYPWWPAIISNLPSGDKGLYRVDFFYQQSHAFVPEDKLIKWTQHRDQYNPHKNARKGLRVAVELANSAYVRADQARKGELIAKSSVELFSTPQILFEQYNYNSEPVKEHNNFILESRQSQSLSDQIQQIHQAPQLAVLDSEPAAESAEEQNADHNPIGESIPKMTKRKFIKKLLQKYKLNSIPKIKQDQEDDSSISKENCRKRNRRGKRRHYHARLHLKSCLKESPAQQTLLARKINLLLRDKQLPLEQRQKISIFLSKPSQHRHGQAQNFIKLFKWLSISSGQTIANFYENWNSIQIEKDKMSSMTNEE